MKASLSLQKVALGERGAGSEGEQGAKSWVKMKGALHQQVSLKVLETVWENHQAQLQHWVWTENAGNLRWKVESICVKAFEAFQ